MPAPVDFTVKVTDGSRTDTKTLRLDVVAPIAATAPPAPASEVGHALKPTTLAVTGGRAPYVWALVNGPPWLSFDPATAIFTGTPDAAGSFPFQVTVKDVYGATATVERARRRQGEDRGQDRRLPVTKVGKVFRAVLRTNGGVGPFSWKSTSGKFPVGIRLDRKTGVPARQAAEGGYVPAHVHGQGRPRRDVRGVTRPHRQSGQEGEEEEVDPTRGPVRPRPGGPYGLRLAVT